MGYSADNKLQGKRVATDKQSLRVEEVILLPVHSWPRENVHWFDLVQFSLIQ
uniref:Predicted protein n=1 Tax=Hordeum vulgare subsp. vulgare TaxID=112509 RepID=F2EFF5_HORVV|nr:predicted protein [Hordeum vulgare subsp. vulgare]